MAKYGSSTLLCDGCRMRVPMPSPFGWPAPVPRASPNPAACSSSWSTRHVHFGPLSGCMSLASVASSTSVRTFETTSVPPTELRSSGPVHAGVERLLTVKATRATGGGPGVCIMRAATAFVTGCRAAAAACECCEGHGCADLYAGAAVPAIRRRSACRTASIAMWPADWRASATQRGSAFTPRISTGSTDGIVG
jgi:hypothetical protein